MESVSEERRKEIRSAFDELVELEGPERETRLEALRGNDPELHQAVRELLRADERAPSVLKRFEPPDPSSGSMRDRISAEMKERLNRALRDRYRLEGELGRGGMAVVYLARDLSREGPVALKVLEPSFARAIGPERFLREIGIERRLSHPNILGVLDFGEADSLLYYVMPYVDGESLRSRLEREGRLPLPEALRIGIQCADALAHAHVSGVIHRDVKPANILLSEEHAWLVDFGVARALDQTEDERLTETGVSLGTVGYMSPEQATGEKDLDAHTDVYSLGCVLYEMLAGEPAFRGPTPQAVLARQLAGEMPSITVVRPEVSGTLEAVVRRALGPEPRERYPGAGELASALRVVEAGGEGV